MTTRPIIEIPTDLVDQFYVMNPEEEDLLFDGSLLQSGMIVLVEDPKMRMSIPENIDEMDPEERYVAETTNRWSEVITVQNVLGGIGLAMRFGDNTQRKRSIEKDYAWIVKRNSRPELYPD